MAFLAPPAAFLTPPAIRAGRSRRRPFVVSCPAFPLVSRSPPCGAVPIAAAQGFGTAAVRAPTPWEREYKAYLRRNGEVLCAMSYAGFRQGGRGAVFADYSPRTAEDDTADLEGIPSVYVTKDQLLKKGQGNELGKRDQKGMDHILSRVDRYDPEKEFVVVFTAQGVMGADVVTPTIPPREVWKKSKGADGKPLPA